MRGGVSSQDLFHTYTRDDRIVMNEVIKDKLETNKAQWDMPKQDIKCSSCGHESKVEVTLDQSNFFVRG